MSSRPAPAASAAPLALGDAPLAIDDLARAARQNRAVALSDDARRRIRAARAVVERFAAGVVPVYGLTTGLGAAVDTRLPPDDQTEFQARALRARGVGIGPCLPEDMVRAVMVARLAGFAAGRSGVSEAIADALIALLDARVHPIIPAIGSIGEADLAPLAQIGLVLLGEGAAMHAGEAIDGRAALARAGLAPIAFGPKDAIALLNANAVSVGPGALVLYDARLALDALDVAAALSFEGFRANLSPLDPRAAALRAVPGEIGAAARLAALLAGSLLWSAGAARRVQDPLSFRCAAPVHGAARAALAAAIGVVEIELNGAGDNPAVLAEHDLILTTANFDTTALALAFEALGQALAQAASLAVGRVVKLMSPGFSELPRFLTPRGPPRTGFAAVQKTAAALEAELRHLALPVSLHVTPVADGVEDYATMAPRVVAKTGEIVARLRWLAALELIVAAQAVDLRKLEALGAGAAAARAAVRALVPPLDDDRAHGPDIEAVASLIASGELARSVAVVTP